MYRQESTCLNPLNRVSWLKILFKNSLGAEIEAVFSLNPLNRVSWLKISTALLERAGYTHCKSQSP